MSAPAPKDRGRPGAPGPNRPNRRVAPAPNRRRRRSLVLISAVGLAALKVAPLLLPPPSELGAAGWLLSAVASAPSAKSASESARYDSYANCNVTVSPDDLADESLWECGRYRLLREYGVRVALLLPSRPEEADVDGGVNGGVNESSSVALGTAKVGQTGTLRLALCGAAAGAPTDEGPGGGCRTVGANADTASGTTAANAGRTFDASGLVIWARFRSSRAIFAATAEVAVDDCASWNVDFVPPLPGLYTVDVLTSWYSPGTLDRWGSGPEGGELTKNTSYRVVRGEAWGGTVDLLRHAVPRGRPRLHNAYDHDNRWMPCDDWCQIHPGCVAWTRNDTVQRVTGTDPRKCMLYSSVNGTTRPVPKGIAVVSAERRWDEPDVTYLGGLSVQLGERGRERCRAESHVWGSPARLLVVGGGSASSAGRSEQVAPSSADDSDEVASLPYCTRQSMANISQVGHWASATLAYPELAAMSSSCPEPCTRDPRFNATLAICTPNDTLPAGICAVDDVTPIFSGWHSGSVYTAEKPLRGYAWVERTCRHRMWTREEARTCLDRMKVDVVHLHGGDVFADLLDRWKLGRVEAWNRKAWVDGFEYEPGVDLLLPTNGDPMPQQLFDHLNATAARRSGDDGAAAQRVAIVVQHLWPMIKSRMYMHRFSTAGFKSQVRSHIAAWEEARQDPRLSPTSRFVVVLSPTVHEFFGSPYYEPGAVEALNRLALRLYRSAGWDVVDAMAMSMARPDHRVAMEWWNVQSHLGEKRSGNGVVHAITNSLFTSVCG